MNILFLSYLIYFTKFYLKIFCPHEVKCQKERNNRRITNQIEIQLIQHHNNQKNYLYHNKNTNKNKSYILLKLKDQYLICQKLIKQS